jgi:LCP family protein required for cell wall assembly
MVYHERFNRYTYSKHVMGTNKDMRPDSTERTTVDGFYVRPRRTEHYYVRRDFVTPATRRPVELPQQPVQAVVESSQPSVQIDMSLPGDAPKESGHPTFKVRKKSARKRVTQVSALAMAFVIGGWALLFGLGLFNAQKAFRGGATAAAIQKYVDPNMLKGEGEGRINVLLMGIGGKGHDGGDLTDTLMIASVDPINHKTSLVSVPRDLWVRIENHGSMKINAAYAMGKYDTLHRFDSSSTDDKAVRNGFALADKTLESVLGITIHYNVLLNFQAFKQAVDTVGGVTVNVPEDLYDPTMAWENNWNPTLAKAGVQHFNGKQALLYARSRETSSDFARSQRQRALMLGLQQKVVELGTLSNPLKMSSLLSTFGSNVVTDLSVGDASRLYDIMKQIPETSVASVGLTDPKTKYVTTGRVGNQSVVLPLAGMYNYTPIQQFIRKSLPDGFIVKENARILIVDAAQNPELAKEKSEQLKSYSYNVVGTISTVNTVRETTLVNLAGKSKPYTQHYLEQRFGLQATNKLTDSSLQKESAEFILIIGSDETVSR